VGSHQDRCIISMKFRYRARSAELEAIDSE
jgi:hypothetical protein